MIINKLKKIANELDERKLYKYVTTVDDIMEKVAVTSLVGRYYSSKSKIICE